MDESDDGFRVVREEKCYEGSFQVCEHASQCLRCTMEFAVFLPPGCVASRDSTPPPVLYFLGGSEDTHISSALNLDLQYHAAKYGICIVYPDTQPRQKGEATNDEPNNRDGSHSVCCYVDIPTHGSQETTPTPLPSTYEHHQHNMHTYITQELRTLVEQRFPVSDDARSIMGVSQGGDGALIAMLKNPHLYNSVSAIAPTCNLQASPLYASVHKYIHHQQHHQQHNQNDETSTEQTTVAAVLAEWEPCALLKAFSGGKDGEEVTVVVDVGQVDPLYKHKHIKPESFVLASATNPAISVMLRVHEGYGGGVMFVRSMMDVHMNMHALMLGLLATEDSDDDMVGDGADNAFDGGNDFMFNDSVFGHFGLESHQTATTATHSDHDAVGERLMTNVRDFSLDDLIDDGDDDDDNTRSK